MGGRWRLIGSTRHGMLVVGVLVLLCAPVRAHTRFPAALQVAFDPSDAEHLVISTSFGLLTSVDGGAKWRLICAPSYEGTEQDSASVAISPNGELIAGLVTGVLRSDRDGCAWARPDPTLDDMFVSQVIAHPMHPAELYAITASSTRSNGLYRSTNAGQAWEPMGYPTGDMRLTGIGIAPSQPQTLYVSGMRPVQLAGEARLTMMFHSDDGGQTLTAHPYPLDEDSYELRLAGVDANDPNRVYAVLRRRETEPLLVSEDSGETFRTLVELPGPLLAFAQSGSQLWVGGEEAGLWHAEDGREFTRVRDDLEVLCLTHHAGFLWVCDGGLLSGFQVGRSDDGGKTFEPVLRFAEVGDALACAEQPEGVACSNAELDDLRTELAIFGAPQDTLDAAVPDAQPADAMAEQSMATGGCGVRAVTMRRPLVGGLFLSLLLLRRRARERTRT